jgi:hypothetical protein
VTSSPGGISCGGDCSESYASGTTVTLSATPTGLLLPTFLGWAGACVGLGDCTVTMNADQTVIALFSRRTDRLDRASARREGAATELRLPPIAGVFGFTRALSRLCCPGRAPSGLQIDMFSRPR